MNYLGKQLLIATMIVGMTCGDLMARGRGGARPSMGSRPSGGSRPSMSRPSPSFSAPRPSSRPSISRPSTRPTLSRPSTGRPSTLPSRPSTGRPSTLPSRPSTGRPGTLPSRPSTGRPGTLPSRPGTGTPGVFPSRPGTGTPGTLPSRPGTGLPTTRPGTPGVFPSRPGTGTPGTLPSRPGTGNPGILPGTGRPTTPGGPSTLPTRPGGGSPGINPPNRPGIGNPGTRPPGTRPPGIGNPGGPNRPGLKPGHLPAHKPGARPPYRPGHRPPWWGNRPCYRPPGVRPPYYRPPWHRPGGGWWWGRPGYYPWAWATAIGISRWITWPTYTTPVVYEYYVSDGNVYNGEEQLASVEDYQQQAEQIVEAAPAPTEEMEWMSLGVFYLTPSAETAPDVMVQLAIAKDGTIGGTYVNQTSKAELTLAGGVDTKTQRAAWKVGDEDAIVMETTIDALTKDHSTVILYFSTGETESWEMFRQDQKDGAKAQAGSERENLVEAVKTLDTKLAGFTTGQSWRKYLALPESVTSDTGKPNADEVAAIQAKYDKIRTTTAYSQIAGMSEFKAAEAALDSFASTTQKLKTLVAPPPE